MKYLLCVIAVLCLSGCNKPTGLVMTKEELYQTTEQATLDALNQFHQNQEKIKQEAMLKWQQEAIKLDQTGFART